MMPDREAKKKALDIMIVMGGKPKDDSYDKDSCEDKDSECDTAESLLSMHPLEKMSTSELKKLKEALKSELSTREMSDEDNSEEDDSEDESDEDSEDYK